MVREHMKISGLIILLGIITIESFGQVYTNKEVGKKNTVLIDS